jgi:hypothetical protein
MSATRGGVTGGRSINARRGGVTGGRSISARRGGVTGGRSNTAVAELANAHPAIKATRLAFIIDCSKVKNVAKHTRHRVPYDSLIEVSDNWM